MARRHFESAEFVPDLWESGSTRKHRWWLYTRTNEVVWMLRHPKRYQAMVGG